MKTSININLFGTLFAIDEDAHQLLQQYLASMKSYFGRQQGGDEIADDIEHRVAELFWELKQQGNQSITIEQVKAIIQEIGNPEDLGGQQTANNSEQTTDNQQQDFSQKVEDSAREAASKARSWMSQRRYYRDPQDKMVGGVLSGLAHYFGTGDPIVWRIIFVLLAIFAQVFPAVIIYVLLWICAPEARTPEERLRMQGKEVNPENIKSQVLGYEDMPSGTQQQQNSGCMGSATGFFALAFKVLLVLMAIPFLFVIAIVLFALFAALFGVIGGLFGAATGITIGGASLFTTLLASEKWTIIAFILSCLAFIALGIYMLYRLLHRDRKPFDMLSLIILLGLMLVSLIVSWQSFDHLRDKAGNLNWGDVTRQFDIDMDDEFDIDDDAIATCDSTFQVPPFDKIVAEGFAKVIFRQADSCTVSVTSSEWMMKHTIVEVNDGCLTLAQDDQSGNSNIKVGTYRICVTAPVLTDVKMQGIGALEIDGTMTQDVPMYVSLSGIGKVDIDNVTCPKLHVENKGTGMMKVETYVDSLIVNNNGIGQIEIEGRAGSYQRNNDGIGNVDDKELKIGI